MGITNWNTELLPYEQAVDEIVLKLKSVRRDFLRRQIHSPIEQVEGRVKSISSILAKANDRNIPIDNALNVLEDIAGIRIICRFVEDIEKVVNIIRSRNDYDMKILQEEDYVTNTKKSGYRSYHITIEYKIMYENEVMPLKCEIQVRTLAMNFWATIEHSLRYKYDGHLPEHLKERLHNCAEAAFKLDTEMTTIRGELLQAKKTKQTQDFLVNEIVKNIHNLYAYGKVEHMNDYNREFMEIFRVGDVNKLSEFNHKLETMAEIYNVRYV
ncbi:MAG: GTP pyrophosphokinase family protein [Firmicutes bacterium]|nr:GTP pyrophosphokinase family protein [Bacillota bacterium]